MRRHLKSLCDGWDMCRVQLSRGGALGAPPASAPFVKAGGGYHKYLVWWAVVDFLAELPQAGFPCSGEVSTLSIYLSRGRPG